MPSTLRSRLRELIPTFSDKVLLHFLRSLPRESLLIVQEEFGTLECECPAEDDPTPCSLRELGIQPARIILERHFRSMQELKAFVNMSSKPVSALVALKLRRKLAKEVVHSIRQWEPPFKPCECYASEKEYEISEEARNLILRLLSPKDFVTPAPPRVPTFCMTTSTKAEALAERHAAGLDLWHPGDLLQSRRELSDRLARIENVRLGNGAKRPGFIAVIGQEVAG